jgi:inhibitor of KinA
MVLLYENPLLRLVGDRSVLVEYGDGISPEINHKVRVMALALDQEKPAGIIEIIPTYRSMLIIYDPAVVGLAGINEALVNLERGLDGIEIPDPQTVEIPVLYGGGFGPDIDFVARHNHLTVPDVIRIHSSQTYQIYMIGFTPGFPFLGGLPEELHTPRLETPRPLVPAGSVGIANNQTGVYPVDSPGGWRLIGRTPVTLFHPSKKDPFLYRAGDGIRFIAISNEEYDRMAGKEAG